MYKQNINFPLIHFLLYPLIFMLDHAYQGIVVSVGLLVIYPFLSMLVDLLYKKIDDINIFYISSFFGIFLGGIYILCVGFIDWNFYEELIFLFPASISASLFFMGWINYDEQNLSEKFSFIDAIVLSFLIILFSCLRDFLIYGTLNVRFGQFGSIYIFTDLRSLNSFEKIIPIKNSIHILPTHLRAICFFFIGFIIILIGRVKNQKQEPNK